MTKSTRMSTMDLYKSCRLCFTKPGTKDVSTAPDYLQVIRHLYNVKIKQTDKYSKLLCDKCLELVDEFLMHANLVKLGQQLIAKRIQSYEQMSHMKVEPATNTGNSSDDSQNAQAFLQIEKQEQMDDDIDDDQITEAPPTPPRERIPDSMSYDNDSDGNERVQAVSQQNGQNGENHSSRDSRVNKSKTTETNANVMNVSAAARINKRRSTTIMGPSDVSSVSSMARKRRMSVVERTHFDENSNPRGRRQLNEITPVMTPPKRMRTNSTTTKPNEATTKSRVTSESKDVPEFTPIKIRVPVASSTPAPVSPNHAKKSSSSHKQRTKKLIEPSTPRITQFFAQQSSPKCDKCSKVLKNPNELDFHLKSHKLKRCIKCHQTIENDDPASIQSHMISCLFLNNQLPKELLTRFLKVKVDLNRLTPTKIEQIQKSLCKEPKTNDNETKMSTDETEQQEKRSNEMETTMEKQLESQLQSQSLPLETESLLEEMVVAPADEPFVGTSIEERQSAKKSKSRKSTNRSHSEEEFTVTENISAAVNWIDEPNKEKLFAIRNFASDEKIYIQIKRVNETGSNLSEVKITNFVKQVKLLQQQVINPYRGENVQKQQVVATRPSAPMNMEVNTQPSCNMINGSVNGSNGTNGTNRTNGTNGMPACARTVPITSNTVQPSNVPHAPHTPNAQTTPKAPTVPNVLHRPNGPNSPNGQNAQSSPIVPHTPNIRSEPITPYASNRSIAPKPSGTPKRSSDRPIAPKPSDTPQLISLPRLPLRHRAMSMHYAAAEYHNIMARRQSVCEKAPSPNDFGPSNNYHQFEHSYTRNAIVKNPPSVNGQYIPQELPPPYMTKVHSSELMKSTPSQPRVAPSMLSTLKVLTPDDLNSRAVNTIVQPNKSNANTDRMDSPHSTENNTNLNSNQPVVKRTGPRTKTTPLRSQIHFTEDTNITISVSLTRLSTNQAELILNTEDYGRVSYESLTERLKHEVQSSLLRDGIWLQMLQHLKTIRPTNETVKLFEKILPKPQHDMFISELKQAYPNLI